MVPMRTVYSASDNAYKLDISSEIEKVFYIGLTAAAVPLAVLLIGLSRWLKRRHQ
jgi:cell division protein FtsL